MKPSEWHERFLQQSEWSRTLRSYILKKINLPTSAKVVEIGCGTGAIVDNMQINFSRHITCLDLNIDFLQFFRLQSIDANLVAADGYCTPFPMEYFDLVYCHFLLLWIKNPHDLIMEMKRISKINGWICCFAEPDYEGRIDYSVHDQEIGQLQNQSLQIQGVNLKTGRLLAKWLQDAGFETIHWGILGTEQTWSSTPKTDEAEKRILQYDLAQLCDPYSNRETTEITTNSEIKAQFTSFVPTFYAYAQNK